MSYTSKARREKINRAPKVAPITTLKTRFRNNSQSVHIGASDPLIEANDANVPAVPVVGNIFPLRLLERCSELPSNGFLDSAAYPSRCSENELDSSLAAA